MKIKEIMETTAGSVASIAQPLGGLQRRPALDSFFGVTQAEMPKRKKKKKKKTTESVVKFRPKKSQREKYHSAIDKQGNYEHRPDAGIAPCDYCGEYDCDYDCDESQMQEIDEADCDNPLALVKTLSVDELAALHGVKDDLILLQLIKGTRVEMEHTKDKKIADEIARDHLKEDPMYYSHLEQMETKYANIKNVAQTQKD